MFEQLSLTAMALIFIVQVASLEFVDNLNAYLEEYGQCRITLFFDPEAVGLKPPSVPVKIKGVLSKNVSNIANLLGTFEKRDLEFADGMVLMNGRNMFCTVYFTILYSLSLSSYVCATTNSLAWKYLSLHVDLIIVARNIEAGNYPSGFCNYEDEVMAIDIRAAIIEIQSPDVSQGK